ncbi:MAG: dihydropteroate synthase [Pararobbsia sp.]
MDRVAGVGFPIWQCGRFSLTLERPLVMGILNVTPDSFSDGGRYLARDAALHHAEQMLAAGVDIIDVGGESTRPGAPPLPVDEELERVTQLIDELRDAGVAISVDTYKPAVMREALAHGADIVNDIWAFRQPGAIEAVAGASCGLCAMHMMGDPLTMQSDPASAYDDVVEDVRHFLAQRVDALEAAGVDRTRIVVDPGFGFGKTVEQNYRLLARLAQTAPPGLPVLAGVSRKSMLGAVTNKPAAGRVAASVAGAVCAAERGAAIVRVHDVAETVDALRVWQAVRHAG